jgi:hypothetical protein
VKGANLEMSVNEKLCNLRKADSSLICVERLLRRLPADDLPHSGLAPRWNAKFEYVLN